MYAYQTFGGGNKLVNHLSSMYNLNISKANFWLGKILANWLSFAKFTNILALQCFVMFSISGK